MKKIFMLLFVSGVMISCSNQPVESKTKADPENNQTDSSSVNTIKDSSKLEQGSGTLVGGSNGGAQSGNTGYGANGTGGTGSGIPDSGKTK